MTKPSWIAVGFPTPSKVEQGAKAGSPDELARSHPVTQAVCETLHAEIKKIKQPLTIELVPQTCWFSNLRSELPSSEWDRLRKAVYARAGDKCEICGGRGKKWPVEAHEKWAYTVEGARHVQRLVRMIALCPSCHEVKHYGLACAKGRGEVAFRHLMKVNGWSETKAQEHVEGAGRLYEERSLVRWELDLSNLDQYGVTPPSRVFDRWGVKLERGLKF